jgi:hypothetical protein
MLHLIHRPIYSFMQAAGLGENMNAILPPFELVSGFPPQAIEEGTEESDTR